VAGWNFNSDHLRRFAQTLERGKFDAFFRADHLAVLNMPLEALKRSATVMSFDPLTLLPVLAVVTEHLGLGQRHEHARWPRSMKAPARGP